MSIAMRISGHDYLICMKVPHATRCQMHWRSRVYVLHNVLVTFVIEMESFKVTKSCVSHENPKPKLWFKFVRIVMFSR